MLMRCVYLSTRLIETDWIDRLELTLSWFTCEAVLPILINVMQYFTMRQVCFNFSLNERWRETVCSKVRVCTSIKVCVQSPTNMSLYACNTAPFPRARYRLRFRLAVLVCLSSGSHLLCVLDNAARGKQGLKCHFMLGNKLSLHYPKPKPEMNFI